MPDSYFELSIADQSDILQGASSKLGQRASILEKDIWVCWTLQTLFNIPHAHPMAFKGGTSLSKIYGVIDRFSEDVDITLDYRSFEEFDVFAEDVSKTQIKKFSERLKEYVKSYANEVVLPNIQSKFEDLPSSEQHDVEIDDTGEKLWLTYPSVVESTNDYLKSQVLIELGGRNVIVPNECHKITPYVSQLTPTVSYPECEVVVLSPERTYWEKATLIHVACNRDNLKENADRLSRHWYDLVMLSQHYSGKNAVKNRKLFEDVICHKKIFFNTGYANYDECLQNNLKLLPDNDSLSRLKADYENMISSGMVYSSSPNFDELIESIRIIECNINNW